MGALFTVSLQVQCDTAEVTQDTQLSQGQGDHTTPLKCTGNRHLLWRVPRAAGRRGRELLVSCFGGKVTKIAGTGRRIKMVVTFVNHVTPDTLRKQTVN